MTITDRTTLARLTGAKAIANTALRWIPPFLPTLERAFGASTTQLTTVLGLGELAGLSTVTVGRQLDRGRERAVMVLSLAAVTLSCIVALGATLMTFAVSFVFLIVGVANFTVAGHAWISHRVDYRWRARSIGIFETSWAFALLIGGPIVAMLINQFGWRGPFVFLAICSAAAAVMVALTLPATNPAVPRQDADRLSLTADNAGTNSPGETSKRRTPAGVGAASANAVSDTKPASHHPLTVKAWLTVAGSALMATAGLSVFVVSGAWLDESFGVSTGGLGYIVMGFGAFELVASLGTAAFADRLGKLPSTLGGIVMLIAGLVVMLSAGDSLAIGVVGILIFLLGFEYGFVTSLSLVSEAMPGARGRTLAVSNAVGTLARSGGVILSGWLFDAHGIMGTAILSGAAGALSFVCLVASSRGD